MAFKLLEHKYAKLMRLHRPIGYMLLVIPIWWFIALACNDATYGILWAAYFFLSSIIARSAGCIINDILDRHIDIGVERTKIRPIAAGIISVKEALIILILLCKIGLLLLLLLPMHGIYITLIACLMSGIYPLMKRFTYYAQIFLGLTFNSGILIASSAMYVSITAQSVMLYAATAFWTVGYDTIYALQDREDDIELGLKSTSILFYENAYGFVMSCYGIFFSLFAIVGMNYGMNFLFYVGVGASLLYAHKFVMCFDKNNASDCGSRFMNNMWLGFILLTSILLGKI